MQLLRRTYQHLEADFFLTRLHLPTTATPADDGFGAAVPTKARRLPKLRLRRWQKQP